MLAGTFRVIAVVLLALLAFVSAGASAHGVDDNTRAFLLQNEGVQVVPFMYIGAKHMITGYDHLLFLTGVIFFLYRSKDILLYVTLFTIGHSTTLLLGVLLQIQLNAYLIDAIIGLSVFYKGFDNLGGFKRCFNWQPDTRFAVFIFGLFHGFGLATKLQDFQLPDNGLLANLVAFNVGVETGQFAALAVILIIISAWRKLPSFQKFTATTNTLLMSAGLMLTGYQFTGYVLS